MPNLNAALGVAQLEDLERRLQVKKLLFHKYKNAIDGLSDVELVAEPNSSTSNHWLIALRFTTENPQVASQQRLQLLEAAHAIGLLIRPVWTLLHQLPMYTSAPRAELSVAEDQAVRLVNLPSSPQLFQ